MAICAYNEEANIGELLLALRQQDPDSALFDDIVVVSSGSTDGTDEIVQLVARSDSRVRLVREGERRGKLAAVNLALAAARNDFIALVDADCLPAPGTLERIRSRMLVPGIGGVGTRNVPVNAGESIAARAGAVLWELHHVVNLRAPVLGGDVIGFRRLFKTLPEEGAVNDDFLIETQLRTLGAEVVYEPEAIVHMRVPSRIGDLFRQRRRIHCGFFIERKSARRFKSTQQPLKTIRAALRLLFSRPTALPALLVLIVVDTVARVAGYWDAVCGKGARHQRWDPVLSTKRPLQP